MAARIEHIVTSGTFSLDGETFDVDNNVWIIGNDDEVVVLDAPHSVEAIVNAIGERTLSAIICTHAHDDHVRVAPGLKAATGAEIWLHPADEPVWELTHPGTRWDHDIAAGDTFEVAGTTFTFMHTPGHCPGSVCIYSAELGVVFTGDTLFNGGPGATGRSFSCYDTIVDSIKHHLFTLPDDTIVHTGHGDSTTIGAERANLTT